MTDRVVSEIQAALEVAPGGATLRPVAVGLATVDLERAAASIGIPVGEDARVDDAFLGARGVVLDLPGVAVRVVLLEPATEARLAAFLARHGEAVVATWHAAADPGSFAGAIAVESALGTSWWVRDPIATRSTGPYRFLIEGAPATISP